MEEAKEKCGIMSEEFKQLLKESKTVPLGNRFLSFSYVARYLHLETTAILLPSQSLLRCAT